MASNAASVLVIEMSSMFFAAVNVPLSVVSIIMNLYFIFCMAFPDQGSEPLKQPLKVLLGSMFGFSTVLHVCSLLWALRDFVFFSFSEFNILFTYIVLDLVLFSVRASVTSSLWLNVFYYSQIVPATCSVLIWLKKNIRLFIYFALILEKTYNLLDFVLNISDFALYFTEYLRYTASNNTTGTNQNRSCTRILLSDIVLVNFWIRLGLNVFNLWAMSAASFATILYLWRHMKSMKNNSTFSTPRLQKQMRVTTTGVIQALLYFFCSTWMMLDALLRIKLPISFDMNRHMLCTVISVYSFATSINVCVGQSMFRQQIAHLWKKIKSYSIICNLNE